MGKARVPKVEGKWRLSAPAPGRALGARTTGDGSGIAAHGRVMHAVALYGNKRLLLQRIYCMCVHKNISK
jgi:hypothetical protein